MIHQRYRQTDGQTTCNSKTALCTIVHRTVKSEWWGAGMVICLGRGADVHMAQQQLMLSNSIGCATSASLP